MLSRSLCALAVLALIPQSGHAEAEPEPIAVVVSIAWETPDRIPLATLRRVYLGRITRWAGRRIERYEIAAGSAVRAAFASEVMGRTQRQLEDYWLEQALTGGAIPPLEVEDEREMLLTIAERAGAIGYLPLAALDSEEGRRLRILALLTGGVTHRPGDPEYPIKLGPR